MKKQKLGRNLMKARVFISILVVFTLLIPSYAPAADEEPSSEPFASNIDDDCSTAEVVIDNIIEPKELINSGEQDVTASFSTVSIHVNGNYDIELNEPWIEHYESPDTNGTPQAHIYTSCDNDNIYIGFKKLAECEDIKSGELFIDINTNKIWDGSIIDTYLLFSYPYTNVFDSESNPVPHSKVAWGDFVEVQIPKDLWPDCNDWGYRISSDSCEPMDECLVNLPMESITAQIAEDYTDSYFDITFSDVSNGYDVENGVYDGWCMEYGPIYTPDAHSVNLYSSACDEILIMGIPLENWSKVNYILNHDLGATYNQKQHAIWHFVNVGEEEPAPPDATTQQLIDNANMYGASYIPSAGDLLAVALKPVKRDYQHTFIQVTVPGDECSWNPNWGNNDHPSETPPDNEFLNFTCSYWYDCICGVAFKALANIWKIHPADCVTIYETDFEDETNFTEEWIAKSFDENDDTWNLSDINSHSPSTSVHCTNNAEYFGNAMDVLEMRQGIDLTEVVNITFSFWHWTEGDTYPIDGQTQIADFGIVEYYLPDEDEWISLQDLALTNQYYDNDWELTQFTIEKSKEYDLSGDIITGESLLQNGNKFRFNWTSDSQFQYEGWYIDDVKIVTCGNEWYDVEDDLIWQSQSLGPDHWCAPWNNTVEKTFPRTWNATEGKYLLNISLQEEPPWCGFSWIEKIITVGDIHDVAVIEIDPPAIVKPGDDVNFTALIKNVGTMDEEDVDVYAKLRKDGTGSPIWERNINIDTLNVSESYLWEFTWEDASYCDYQLEVTAVIDEDEVPANNTKYKWILVADTLFFDPIDEDCAWTHQDLTGGIGHWNICTSGYDDYLWCGLQETTKYDNMWNDVAIINKTFNITNNNTFAVSFETQYQMNESDYGIVEYSPDNGRHWYAISPEITGYSNWTNYTFVKNVSTDDIEKAKVRFRFYSNETITDRGWIIDDIIIETDNHVIFEDDIDTNGVDNWIIERIRAGDWWQISTKAKPDDVDNTAWWCGDELSLMYPNNLNNILVLNGPCAETIDLTKAFSADIVFNTWYELKDDDIGYVELSTDDGESWTILETISGVSDSWEDIWIPIDDYLGEIILLRFRFTSDNSKTAEGWYIDDVRIVAKIDENPPTSTADVDGTMGNNDWYTSGVTVSLSATDDYSGVAAIYYELDGGSTETYTSPITVSDDGSHDIDYWAVDGVGNTESTNSVTFKIDKTDPETPDITKPSTGIYLRDRKIWPLIEFSVFAWDPPRVFGAITITVDTDDATSGIDTVEFFIDGASKEVVSSTPYEYTWDERAFFLHTIKVVVTDNAGNTAETTKDIKIFNLNLFGQN